MAISKITTNSITDDAVTTAKVNPAQTDITSVGTLTSATVSGDLTVDTDTLKVDASEDTVCINTTATNFDAGADDLIVGSGSGDSGITIYTGSSVGDKGSIFFADSTVGSSAEKKGQISYEQNNEIMTFFTNDTLAMQIDLNGHVTMPKQSAFMAYLSISISNLAQGGSETILRFQTERFDLNADYNDTSYTFTAPVAGKYQFNASVRLDQMQSNTNYNYVYFKTSNRTYTFWLAAPQDWNGSAYYTLNGSILADLDASDTCYIGYVGQGGTDATDHTDGFFSGHLVA